MITLTGVSDEGPVWSSRDFVHHYYHGNGLGVTIRETGHLADIVTQYMNIVQESLQNGIAGQARRNPDGRFDSDFYNSYYMTSIVFSIGDTVIGGKFSGLSSETNGILTIAGKIEFYLRDVFIDPLDVGVEVIDIRETIIENILRPILDDARRRHGLPPTGIPLPGLYTGEPYPVTDSWAGHF